jgi:hypothetical protein
LYRRFVRLYYIEDLTCDDLHLSITLAFPFDAELMLKFKGAPRVHCLHGIPAACTATLLHSTLQARAAQGLALPARWGRRGGGLALQGRCRAAQAARSTALHHPHTLALHRMQLARPVVLQIPRRTTPGAAAWLTCCSC